MVVTSPRASSASRLNSRVSSPTVTVSYGSPGLRAAEEQQEPDQHREAQTLFS